MEKNLSSALYILNSEVKRLNKQIKNLIDLLDEAHQKRQYSIRETEILTEQNGKDINYLTAQINYNIKKF